MSADQQRLQVRMALQAFVDRLEGIYGGPVAMVLVATAPGLYVGNSPLNIISNIEKPESIKGILEIAARIATNSSKEQL